jgi:hypothetical protein
MASKTVALAAMVHTVEPLWWRSVPMVALLIMLISQLCHTISLMPSGKFGV